MFLLRCPHCKNDMKYATNTQILADKRKKCVYCPKSFGVKDNVLKTL